MNDLAVLRKRHSAQHATPQTREYIEALEAQVERQADIRKALVRDDRDKTNTIRELQAEVERLKKRIPNPDDLRAAATACELVADDLHSASRGRSENVAIWRERANRLRATLEEA